VLLFLLFAISFSSARADWVALGPDGGNFLGAAINPDNPLEITSLVTGPLECYRSSDGGASWTSLVKIDDDYAYRFQAFDFSKLYLLTDYGLQRSNDGGQTWTLHPIPYDVGYATSFCVDPSDSEKIYAAGEQYTFAKDGSYQVSFVFIKSVDGGTTWDVVTGFTYDYIEITGIAVAKTDPAILYAVGIMEQGTTYNGVLLASADGGATWTDKTAALNLLSSDYLYDVAVDPTNANRIYLAGPYPYTSGNGGASWTHTSQSYPLRVVIDPQNPATVYFGGSAYLVRSTNSGLSWNGFTGPVGTCAGLAIKPGDPLTLYDCTSAGFYKSTNGGSVWTAAHSGIHHSTISSLAVAPSQPTTLAAENPNVGVYTTANSGTTWKAATTFTNCGTVEDLLIGLNDPQVVIALNGFT